jgi:hypothetical protein
VGARMMLDELKIMKKKAREGQKKESEKALTKEENKHHNVSRIRSWMRIGLKNETPLLPSLMGVVHTKRPAFLEIVPFGNDKNLIVSGFCPFRGYNEVKMIPNIKSAFQRSHEKVPTKEISLTKKIYWPNNVTPIDSQLFGKEGFLVASGFILKPGSVGGVFFIDQETFTATKITVDRKNWFYHQAIPYNLKRDGNLGILTSRCNKQIFSLEKSKGELVWFEKPKNAGDPWKENILVKGPDVYYTLRDIDQDGKNEIIATDFFHDKLYLIKEEKGKFEKVEIDKKIKRPFDVTLVDLNNDGKLELLVTNHTNKGSVYVYEIPQDVKNGEWKRHEILSNITCRIPIPSEGAPGNAITFYPKRGMGGKPYIFVSGDGSGKVHMLIPKKPMDPQNWEYHEKIIHQDNCTIGKIKMDFDELGYARLFVPLYEKNKILCYSFNPAQKA